MGIKSGTNSIKHSNENSQNSNSRTVADNFNDEEQYSLKRKLDPIAKSFGLMGKLDN
jgi:hypothetical protein